MRRLAVALAALTLLSGPSRAQELLAEAAGTDARVERQMHELLVHALLGRPATLAADIAGLEAFDVTQRDAGAAPSGLVDDARYLAAAIEPNRDARREALRDLLDRPVDEELQRIVELQLETDDATAADRLLADDRHNRRAALVNDAVRPLGAFSGTVLLAAINPFLIAGSAIDSVATTAVNLWNYNRLSSAEREAFVRYRTELERTPDTAEAPEIARAIRHLGTKRAEALCTETIAQVERALDDDDLDHARYYLSSAGRVESCQPDDAVATRVTTAVKSRDAANEASRWPADDPLPPPAGAADYEALAVATVQGNPSAMRAAVRRMPDDGPLAPSAAYVLAVAAALDGDRAAARAAFADVPDDSAAGAQAAAWLASSDFTRLDALRSAERRHLRDTVRFVLLGKPTGRSAVYAAAQVGAEGAAAAQTLGVLNVIGMATRAWQVWRRDPVSNQEIIDRGEELLAREPDSPDAAAVHDRLATAYERSGHYGRALMHLRALPDPDDDDVARVEGKLADELLAAAERDGNDPLALATIVRHFGATDAAETARERLRTTPVATTLVVPRTLLETSPRLAGPGGLDLDPALLDGDVANGELTATGVTLANGALQLAVERDDGERTENRPVPPDDFARARAAAEDALYVQRLVTNGDDPEAGRYERYIPIYLQGSIGESGVAVYPGVKMRRSRSENPELYQ